MQLDDLQRAWAVHGALLEKSVRIDERLLREVMVGKVKSALGPHVLWRALEVVLGLAVIVLVGGVLPPHLDAPRYLALGGMVLAFAIAMTAKTAYLAIRTWRLDYSRPVAAIQTEVAGLKLLEYRAFKWALLGGIVLWLPAALLLFEACVGVDALARAPLPWLAANVAFGLAVLALGQWLSRKHVERTDLAPWARRFVDSLSGRRLEVVRGHLAELADFTRDPAP